jgi:hypothetical protein
MAINVDKAITVTIMVDRLGREFFDEDGNFLTATSVGILSFDIQTTLAALSEDIVTHTEHAKEDYGTKCDVSVAVNEFYL